MSKDAIHQAQLEDLAEKTYTMQQYFQEFTNFVYKKCSVEVVANNIPTLYSHLLFNTHECD